MSPLTPDTLKTWETFNKLWGQFMFLGLGWPEAGKEAFAQVLSDQAAADRAALAEVRPYIRHLPSCQVARAWGPGPGGTTEGGLRCDCGRDQLAALALAASEETP